jgi:hypothetical protein
LGLSFNGIIVGKGFGIDPADGVGVGLEGLNG